MQIAGHLLTVDRDDIAAHVDLDAVPAGTEVRAYTLVHEGSSQPYDMDTGARLRLRWGGAVVRRVAALVRKGTAFVRSHRDRTKMGEVIGGYVAEVGGRLRAVVIGAFAEPSAEMDVCSIEASGVTHDDQGTVLDVKSVDAIALGRSDRDRPGFPGAVLMGSVQCFVDDEPEREEEVAQIGMKDIQEFLALNTGVVPGQLFSDSQIEAHPGVARKLSQLETKTNELTRQLSRRDARDAMREKVRDWIPEAKFHADVAFDGWETPTTDVADLDEWVKVQAERYKVGTGNAVLPPPPPKDEDADYGDTENSETSTMAPLPASQPNEPPSGGRGSSQVDRLLTLIKKADSA